MKKKNNEESFCITPKGLIMLSTIENTNIWNDLELHCYRYGYNAILINKDGGEFIKVKKEK